MPTLPGGLKLGKEGLKVLGAFLGNEDFQTKNCEGVKEMCMLGCLNGNGCYLSCHVGEELWLPITWSPRLFVTDSLL